MLRWSIVSLLLTISIKWENYTVHGFLFTPKFQIFLNQLRQNQAYQQFVVNWDFNNSYNSVNNNGFSYATNQNGMFINSEYVTVLMKSEAIYLLRLLTVIVIIIIIFHQHYDGPLHFTKEFYCYY